MKGLTLIEIIIVIVLVGILSIGMAKFIIQTIDTWRFVDIRNELSEEGKKAVDWMVRDIKEIKDERSINIADVSHLNFDNSNAETIDFIKNGSTLERNSFSLADNVANLTFRYFDGQGNELTPPLSLTQRRSIRKIRIEITLRRDNQEVNFFTNIIPRNLYD
jgi:prepilin-type N-terminal cleavage/methylation domain-containing protein